MNDHRITIDFSEMTQGYIVTKTTNEICSLDSTLARADKRARNGIEGERRKVTVCQDQGESNMRT